ncbi:hypothetical protein GGTG_05946 [Gaeumannomyces tritici R3-111a-1]|uniref:Uncharacterized protein n=1 Tax=Gaeumannomyces tritici (strain R3-111a-1) TaxID=644352 RepID=J3NXE0_GAET3|nr:hypothetical protein GGTG_05946 [Gaeumannomyces tritici R3-111a-1]EJT76022.1 hypothetical protein GGTG_05946 [Gaeumannomyces tritici R3-111a-1]
MRRMSQVPRFWGIKGYSTTNGPELQAGHKVVTMRKPSVERILGVYRGSKPTSMLGMPSLVSACIHITASHVAVLNESVRSNNDLRSSSFLVCPGATQGLSIEDCKVVAGVVGICSW